MTRKHSPNLKLLLLLIPIAAVVATSGCTGSGGATFGNGVTILNWEPTFSSVESGDNVQFRARIQNQGEVQATSVSPVIIGISPEEWGLAQQNAAGLFGLAPPDRVRNTEGEIRQDVFDSVAPRIPKGTTQTFTPQLRVYYQYTTTASKLITVVNEGELKRLQDKGQTLPSKDTVSSAGPLKVTVNAGKFIKAKDAGYSYSRQFPITIDIQNVGGGVVSTQSMSSSSANDYKIDSFNIIYPTSRLNINCPGASGSYYGNGITLWKGQTATVTCTVNIGQAPIASEEANLQVILQYHYYIDASTTVTVTGVDEGVYGSGFYAY